MLAHLSLLEGSATREATPGLHRGQKVCPTRAISITLKINTPWDLRCGRGPQQKSRPAILLLIMLLPRGLVCPSDKFANLLLYLSRLVVDSRRKIASFRVELRKSG